jgi:ADP-ribose pyrophosphatase YjhB (NUDIX family)
MSSDFKGQIFQITSKDNNGKRFEYAQRAPGTRTIIDNGKEILLIEEFRTEQNRLDLRLPGGKVYDTLDEYLLNIEDDMLLKAKEGAIREIKQETGIIVNDLELLRISKCGATVIWDLYYFVSKGEIVQKEQELGDDEKIKTVWMPYKDVIQACIDGKVNEDRTLGILLKYVLTK